MSPRVQAPGDATPSAPVDTTGEATRPPFVAFGAFGELPHRGVPRFGPVLDRDRVGVLAEAEPYDFADKISSWLPRPVLRRELAHEA